MLQVQSRKRKRLHNKLSQEASGEDTNFEIIVKKDKKKVEKIKGLTAAEKNAKKKEKKRLEKVKEKKQQREERERILKSLEKHAVPSEQLNMYHSSCGRRPNASLFKEQAKRAAVIVNHKKKNRKSKLDKMNSPIKEAEVSSSSSSEAGESGDDSPVVEQDTVQKTEIVAQKTEKEQDDVQSDKPRAVVAVPVRVKRASVSLKEAESREPTSFVRFV